MVNLVNVGKVCFRVGIDPSSLLSYVSAPVAVQLPEIQASSNTLILELLRFKDQHSQCTFKVFYCWLKEVYGGKNWLDETPPTPKAITRSVRRLMEVFEMLNKISCKTEVTEFIKQEYILPKLGIYNGKVVHFNPVKQQTAKERLMEV